MGLGLVGAGAPHQPRRGNSPNDERRGIFVVHGSYLPSATQQRRWRANVSMGRESRGVSRATTRFDRTGKGGAAGSPSPDVSRSIDTLTLRLGARASGQRCALRSSRSLGAIGRSYGSRGGTTDVYWSPRSRSELPSQGLWTQTVNHRGWARDPVGAGAPTPDTAAIVNDTGPIGTGRKVRCWMRERRNLRGLQDFPGHSARTDDASRLHICVITPAVNGSVSH